MLSDIRSVRAEFPALQQQVYGKPLVYLDNAATAQKPKAVLRLLANMEGGLNGNIHRAVHYLSAQCTERYEEARRSICDFIAAEKVEEIIFTSGATAAVNLVAFSFGEAFVREGDVILVGEAEHHSNIVPWQMMCARKGATVRVLPVDATGRLRMDLLPDLLDEKVRLVAIAHVSNVLGIVNPIKEIVQAAHQLSIPVLVDGAQGIVHCKVNVKDLDCDFYLFSGHKIYGPTGTGVLYGKERWLEQLPPWQGGGDMIASVSFSGTKYAALPLKFEAGTPNFIGLSGLGEAIRFVNGLDKEWALEHEQKLCRLGLEALQGIEGLRLYGTGGPDKIPVFSFFVDGVHATDMAMLLDKMGYAVRSGQMCAEPLLAHFGQTSLLRASFALYNTVEELTGFIAALQKVLLMLR